MSELAKLHSYLAEKKNLSGDEIEEFMALNKKETDCQPKISTAPRAPQLAGIPKVQAS